MFDLFTRDDFDAALDAKLVKIRESGDGQRILNYADAAMWTPGAWDNPAVRTCRGLIVDAEGFVVARPWAKFFNYGQAEADVLELGEPVEVSDKMDGSLGVLHYDAQGRPRVATRGSFASDQAVHATAVLASMAPDVELYGWWPRDFTPLVEIVYPENRIVCDYGRRDALVMLGGVWTETGAYVGPREAARIVGHWPDADVTEVFEFSSLSQAMAAEPREGAEGLVVRSLSGSRMVKLKQADYIALHKAVTGLSERGVWERMMAGATLAELLAGIPDELHGWVREVTERLENQRDRIVDEAHQVFETLDSGDRKTFALAVAGHELRPYLFMLLDGRDLRLAALKSLKPAGDRRAVSRSEDVA